MCDYKQKLDCLKHDIQQIANYEKSDAGKAAFVIYQFANGEYIKADTDIAKFAAINGDERRLRYVTGKHDVESLVLWATGYDKDGNKDPDYIDEVTRAIPRRSAKFLTQNNDDGK